MSQGYSLTWMHRDVAIPDLHEEPNCRHVSLIFNHVMYKSLTVSVQFSVGVSELHCKKKPTQTLNNNKKTTVNWMNVNVSEVFEKGYGRLNP